MLLTLITVISTFLFLEKKDATLASGKKVVDLDVINFIVVGCCGVILKYLHYNSITKKQTKQINM